MHRSYLQTNTHILESEVRIPVQWFTERNHISEIKTFPCQVKDMGKDSKQEEKQQCRVKAASCR
jgi:hypothetical protein